MDGTFRVATAIVVQGGGGCGLTLTVSPPIELGAWSLELGAWSFAAALGASTGTSGSRSFAVFFRVAHAAKAEIRCCCTRILGEYVRH